MKSASSGQQVLIVSNDSLLDLVICGYLQETMVNYSCGISIILKNWQYYSLLSTETRSTGTDLLFKCYALNNSNAADYVKCPWKCHYTGSTVDLTVGSIVDPNMSIWQSPVPSSARNGYLGIPVSIPITRVPVTHQDITHCPCKNVKILKLSIVSLSVSIYLTAHISRIRTAFTLGLGIPVIAGWASSYGTIGFGFY